MEQKKYMNIKTIKEKYTRGFSADDHIVVQEKIDGANFSIRYDPQTDAVAAFSRNNPVIAENNLRGAYNWSQKLDKTLVRNVLGDNLILFGEWLVPHTIVYPSDRYGKAYFYDVYDTAAQAYLPQDSVEAVVKQLDLLYVPVFYDGKFISWEHLYQFIGKTDLGGDEGEGIVIKNITRLNDPNEKLPYYIKIVSERFAETHKVRKFDGSKIEQRTRLQAEVEAVVTPARVTKLVHKMVDAGIIPENWGPADMAIISKHIGREVYYDCLKEEPEIVKKVGEVFGKFANRIAVKIIKNMMNER